MQELLNQAEVKMQKTVDALKREYDAVRAGRATPAVLNKIRVDYYGVPTPIEQMAAVSVVEARTLAIQPWDVNAVKDIEKAILSSDIGITPVSDGRILRLNFPPLTEERRKELVKETKKMAEESKVSVRSARRDAIEKAKAMQKNSELTEDDEKKCENDIQKLTDKYVKIIDETSASKEKEILEI